MHEASLQALEATTKKDLGKGCSLLVGAWDGVLADCFLTRRRPVSLIKLIGSFNVTQCFRQGNRGQSAKLRLNRAGGALIGTYYFFPI
jgi:hypothetical protein